MKDNVILIGMPGVGKSTIGVLLAKNLGYDFVDSDLVIQRKAGRKLQAMIDDIGPKAFAAYEDRVNAELETHNAVIATGGSAVYGENAMKHFKEIGLVVYLRASYETIVDRIPNFETRGIVVPEGKTFRDVYDERVPLYEKYADITVDTEEGDLWAVGERITEAIKSSLN